MDTSETAEITTASFQWHRSEARAYTVCMQIVDLNLPSGESTKNYMERSTIFDGKIYYFYGHLQ